MTRLSIESVTGTVRPLAGPFAVRSSAVDEDGADASFAGQHVTLLNVPTVDALPPALGEIWWSANSDSAISYRKRVGLFTRPSVAVVVQKLLDPDTAGVMFTRNPVTGADERMIEASSGSAKRSSPVSSSPTATGSTATAACSRTGPA